MIVILMKNYPKRMVGITQLANRFTQLKTLFILSSVALILLGIIALAIRTFTSKYGRK